LHIYTIASTKIDSPHDFYRVPTIVHECIQEIEERGILAQGIFRVSGSAKRIKSLLQDFNTPEAYGFGQYQDFYVANLKEIMCMILPIVSKSFLDLYRNHYLPEHFIHYFYPCLVCSSHLEMKKEEQKIHALQLLILLLPTEHILTFMFLFQFLKKVSQNSDKNQMEASNLGTIFGPSLMWESNDVQAVSDYAASGEIISFLIRHHHEFQFHEHPPETFLLTYQDQQRKKRDLLCTNRSSTASSESNSAIPELKNSVILVNSNQTRDCCQNYNWEHLLMKGRC
jgi:hypothetical protein